MMFNSDWQNRIEKLERLIGKTKKCTFYGVDINDTVMVRLDDLEAKVNEIRQWTMLIEKKLGAARVTLDNGEVILLNTKQEPSRGYIDERPDSE
jgi:hypothetical protein